MKHTCLTTLALALAAGGVRADAPPKPDAKPMWQRMLQGEDAKKAAALEELIDEHRANGRVAKAVEAAKHVVMLRERAQGADHWQVRDAQFTLEELKGPPLSPEQRQQREEARQLFNQVAALSREGKYREAVAPAEAALRLRQQVLGASHPHTANCLNDLAALYRVLGAYAKAEPLYLDALRIRRRILGADHPDTATTLNNLARLYRAQGAFANAEPLYLDALQTFRQVLGEAHPDTAACLNNLAALYRAQGAFAKAEPLYVDALRIRRHALGEAHPDTAAALNNLAALYYAQGEYAKAESLDLDALRIRRHALGETHPDTAQSLNNLAFLYKAQREYAKAEPLYLDALRISRQILGQDHPDTAGCLDNLAGLHRAQGAYAKAEPLYLDALRIRRRVLGEAHPDIATTLNNLAFLHWAQGAYAKAEPLYLDALRIYRQVLGEFHPHTAACLDNLATLHRAQGGYARAEPLYLDALRIRRRVLGEAHPDTATTLRNLAYLHRAQGAYRKAESTLGEAVSTYEASRMNTARGIDRSVASGRNSPYPIQAAIAASGGQPNIAYRSLEADLARGLLDEQATQRGKAWTDTEQAERDALAGRFGVIQPRILRLATRPKRTEAEEAELDVLVAERVKLDSRAAELAAALSRREVADLAAIQRAIPTSAALVAWADVTDNVSGIQEHWACVVRTVGEPTWEQLRGTGPDRKWTTNDDSLPRRFRSAAAGAAPASEVDHLGRQLYIQRLAPLEKHLAGVKKLIVVAAGKMAGVPVEALTNSYVISYAPSGTVVAKLKARPRPAESDVALLAVGDPTYRSRDAEPALVRLPPGGLLVSQVVPSGIAAAAHIRPGDVLLAYAGTDLTSFDHLGQLIAAHSSDATVPVKVWRSTEDKPAVRHVAPGKLGVVLDKRPAPEAIAVKQKADQMVAKLRGGDWSELPGTRVELDRLARIFGDRATILAGPEASERRLYDLRASGMLKSFRYLHLASHGQANDAMAFESALILAQVSLDDTSRLKTGEPHIDGKLTAREVLADWELDAELVTLSACESGLGREGGGDGLLGFAQAFLKAGARSVCLSLWKVDDAATALLMDRFYANLITKTMPKAAALAEAKAWLRALPADEATKQLAGMTNGVSRGKGAEPLKLTLPAAQDSGSPHPFAHPRYWAGFILIGDPN